MGRLLILIAALLALAPSAALAGGFATVSLSSMPTGTKAGEPWDVDITVLQHGVTPMTDVHPAVVITLPNGDERRFGAKPVDGKPGVYRTSVVFPTGGTYDFVVDDGFTNAFPHTYPPVTITGTAPAAVAAPGGGIAWQPFAIAAAAVALLSLAALVPARRRSSSSAARRSARAAAPGPTG